MIITERIYEELRRYEDGRPTSLEHQPTPALTTRYLRLAGHGFWQITESGVRALTHFRDHHKIPT
jgi:hypothetical protein